MKLFPLKIAFCIFVLALPELASSYTLTNGNLYEGELKNNLPHGKGKITSKDWVYEGELKNGMADGKGKLTAFDGSSYEGEFKNDKYNGKGRLNYGNGSFYEGEFKDGQFNGKGKIVGANGIVYEGDFKEGKADGKGKYVKANGDVYVGEMKNDKIHGRGKLVYANGSVYEGDFVENLREGMGKYITDGGDYIYEGEWKDDEGEGKGKLTISGYVVEGEFKNGLLLLDENECQQAQNKKFDDDASRSREEVMHIITACNPELRKIYNSYLKKKPDFAGKVTLKFTITANGSVTNANIVSSTTGYPDFDNAIKNAVAKWKWRAIKSGNTTPTIPFNFSE